MTRAFRITPRAQEGLKILVVIHYLSGEEINETAIYTSQALKFSNETVTTEPQK